MAKRGRKPKAKASFDANVSLVREVVAVVLVVLGLVALLALFNAGGQVGVALKNFFFYYFGMVAGAILPLLMVVLGLVMLSVDYLRSHKKQVIGTSIAFIIFIGLLNNFGGVTGSTLNQWIQEGFGAVGAYLVLIALLLIDLVFAFGVSIKRVFERLNFYDKERGKEDGKASIENQKDKVSVFRIVRKKMRGWTLRKPHVQEKRVSTVRQPSFIPSNNQHYEPPPLSLLATRQEDTEKAERTIELQRKKSNIIKKKLKDFNIEVELGGVNVGPTITQLEFKPAEGVKLNQITSRAGDLALALAAEAVRIEAPIPGRGAVGVEVPNEERRNVTLREILEHKEFDKVAEKSNLILALGLDVAGNPMMADLAKLPHLLVAGATGSGKSVCVNSMITCLIYQNSPEDLRFILVDPKRVEFTPYNGIPHLLTPVIVEADKTINILKWTVAEMERRFRVFQDVGVRDLGSYNERVKKGEVKPGEDGTVYTKMPNIVLIIDELSDLMAQSANEVEGAIVRIAQMARATGIHLIIATQRPSVNVITGLIKANVPARVAFAVASQVDSRTIIDMAGAEKLIGNGDMLYLSADTGKPKRIQGVLVSDEEIKQITDFLKKSGHAVYDQTIADFKPTQEKKHTSGGSSDPMYDEAKELVIQTGKASATFIQRRLRVGYARAAHLLDAMEDDGVVGPGSGAKPREVYVDSLDAPSPTSAPPAQSNNSGFVAPVYTTSEPSYSPVKKSEALKEGEGNEEEEGSESRWPKSVPPPSAPLPKVESTKEEKN
ncbi:MAG TPA: DNA translocase FtsK 4TM domain-containing protein [bacterium]|mgnify:CR=1 FL=1|nr:DNA translocase FtsK 4TM domain-containing protein [bacterium]